MNRLDGLAWRAVVTAVILIAGFTLQNLSGRQQRIDALHATLRANPAWPTPAECTAGLWPEADCQLAAEVAYQAEGLYFDWLARRALPVTH